ncbi:TraR/DksA C4-type zinc finger protein [Nocardioides sp. ChNu-153]|uniref:TraR/DksA family transcriptional regulator n=1 Tax=unclassified Nocardioides TaxID=2615069 RepID=UPI002405904C|nr:MULTISPECIES: TraR/DksA C4-type zinc finger protein [unclassified Nocardioides]MDF9716715.1 TraR/DksA C4-type zinc finger protein [Nocardioides sp. ChNu-99]MDN7121136.1 TraR/DksA C4-type zinc finger protein [Nocardioides sp. ChNu-153]
MSGTTDALRAERAAVLARIERLRVDHAGFVAASRDSNADDEHDPEGATIAFERAQVEALLREAERRLADVDAALERAGTGGYGTCTVCGRPIDPARLEVRPSATTCVACAPARRR